MQKIRKFVPTVLFACLVHVAFSQDSTFVEEKAEKKIQYTPYYSVEKLKSLGNYVGLMDDSIQFQLSAGISVFNTLLGFVPNAGVDLFAPNGRAGTSLFVVDGIPHPQSVLNHYNLNSFDYSNITFLSRGNAASVYGVYGSDGAYLLKTKTGENHHRPAIEFNSYATLGWSDPIGLINPSSTQETYTQWYFSNSIAYMQDYGKIDTRISYNFRHTPSPNHGENQKSNQHNFRVNTGFEITPKFKARLILDKFFSIAKFESPGYGSLPGYMARQDRDFLQGNLLLKYQLTPWLKLSSQTSLVRMENDSERANDTTHGKTDRLLTNLFLSADKLITPAFSVTPFIGIQYEETKTSMRASQAASSQEINTTALLGGIGINFKKYFFINLNYRDDRLSMFPSSEKSKPTSSVSTAFVFSDALRLNNSFFSFGKIRASIGKTFSDGDEDSDFVPVVSKKNTEFGTDLTFFDQRVSLTFNYFDEASEKILESTIPGTAGYIGYLVRIGDVRKKGTELIMGVTAVKGRAVKYEIYAMAMRTKHRVDFNHSVTPNPGIPDPVGVLIGDPEPSWTGSLLNRVVLNHFMLSVLVDTRQGGTIMTTIFGSGGFNVMTYDGTQMKLRDVSLGYHFARSFFNKVGVKRTSLSASARNLLLLYSASGNDAENVPGLQKSTSLSLSLYF